MIKADYHFHSEFSSDSNTPIREQFEAGIKKGLKIMCVTDHLDYDWPDDPEGFDFLLDLDSYFKTIDSLKNEFIDQVDIRAGVELGIQRQVKANLDSFITNNSDKLDFIIASTHLVDHLDVYYKEYFDINGDNSIKKYLETTLDNLDIFTDFNVYAHLDYIVRPAVKYGYSYEVDKYMDIYDAILKKIIDLGKGIELNTAAFKAGLAFAHPHPSILKRYRELGGEIITIGSDAHESKHIALKFNDVPEILSNAGFKYYTVFKNQKPEFLPL